ncbi:hypothetical protein [Fischerella sp. PCC 9605]|uniref:hypothetical protein n=1 Tax=Fischerella sp. PCC 9605 TaxID=1173024 RepID=UPI00047BACFA|nr:hypothetical protein [Fischerella sp. PCC 9605]
MQKHILIACHYKTFDTDGNTSRFANVTVTHQVLLVQILDIDRESGLQAQKQRSLQTKNYSVAIG